MSDGRVTLLDARWRLHVAEDREASHQVRCRSSCTAGASACDTGRARLNWRQMLRLGLHERDGARYVMTSKGRAFSSLRDAYGGPR